MIGIERARLEIAAVEQALSEGHPIYVKRGHIIKSAVRVAADRLGMPQQTLSDRVGKPDVPGTSWRLYEIKVDWSKYKPREGIEAGESAEAPAYSSEAAAAEGAPPPDPITERRLRDDVSRLKSALKDAERRAAEAEARERGVLGLTQEPLRARLVIPTSRPESIGGRTVIIHLSDIQYGETVYLDEMDGLNRYDAQIAKVRIGRFFTHAVSLMTEHWKGAPPDEVILCLGGDMISGNLHKELEETNLPSLPETVREVGEHIAGGIVLVRAEVKCPMRVYQVPGNHGRSTPKPQSKRRSASSFDMLAGDFTQAATRGLDGVTWYRSPSPDAYFSTYGWHWLMNHGDTMGGRGGGTGFIGPMAAIIKGHRKLVDTSWRSGKAVHFVLTGHYHTTGKTSFGWANGSVAGYNEFARDLRADPEPARQNMLVVHPRHGVITEQPLYLGAPEEGSLYTGPATVVRPQWVPEADDDGGGNEEPQV